jgi:ferredoxin
MIPAVVSCLLLAAHHLRFGEMGLVAAWLTAPFLLSFKEPWVRRVFIAILWLGAVMWIAIAAQNWQTRVTLGQPWARMVLILGGVAALTAGSSLIFFTRAVRERYRDQGQGSSGAGWAFFVTAALLSAVQVKAPLQPLLFERAAPGGGWFEVFWLSVYAGWLAEKMMVPGGSRTWRPWAWSLFSTVFFLQFLLGLLGFTSFLMTGELHLPVPAMIVAGPLFRGNGFFMPILFGATVLIVGPAWCSHLCYIGAWDDRASRLGGKPTTLPRWRRWARAGTLAGVIAVALLLRWLKVPGTIAALLGGAFGIIGVGLMATWSRKTGTMTHCTAYCPMGFIACRLGKISPFRLRIGQGCTECGACSRVCRYDALSDDDLRNRRPGESCTLCGDCLPQCRNMEIGYGFLSLTPDRARALFVVLVVSLHAVFLGVARM